MNVLSKIFSSGATELIKGVGGVIDNLHTSKEEKKIGVYEKVTEGTVKRQDAIRKRRCKESGGTWNDKTKSCE